MTASPRTRLATAIHESWGDRHTAIRDLGGPLDGCTMQAAAILATPSGKALLRDLDAANERGVIEGLDAAIYLVQQSLDSIKDEDDESRAIKVSVAAREHVIWLLTGYRDRLAARAVVVEGVE